VAYELGVEGGQFKLGGKRVTVADRVTNIYRREAEVWKIVHHHTDIAQSAIDALTRLKKKQKKKKRRRKSEIRGDLRLAL
jgi:SnoaL-like domain